MLLLNAGLFLNLRLISFNLNTSYVTVKQQMLIQLNTDYYYLNTSYVTVKLASDGSMEVGQYIFKYIICYC